MFRGKTILITGASGFIGSHLTKRLLSKKANIHIIRSNLNPPQRLMPYLASLTSHLVDLRDEKNLKKTILKIKPTAVFHLANEGLYGGQEKNETTVWDVNFTGTRNLLKVCEEIPYEIFVNTGSSSEYGAKNKKMSESDICLPEGMYAISKLAATLYARYHALSKNKPVVTLRLFSPYGPFDDKRRLITSVIKNSVKNKNISIGNPENVRDFIYIDDVINAYEASYRQRRKLLGQIINIGSGKQKTVSQTVEAILDLTKSKSRVLNHVKIKRIESKIWEANVKKANDLLGWKPETEFYNGLKKTIDWYKNENA